MGIYTDAGHTWEAEVEPSLILIRRRITRFLEESNDERPQAAVDVKGNLVRDCQPGQSRDIINDTMREVGCRTDQQDSVAINQTTNGGNMDFVFWCRAWHTMKLDPKILGSFVESSMRGIRNDPAGISIRYRKRAGSWGLHFWFRYTALSIRLLARCETGHNDRFRTTTCGDPSSIRGTIEQREDLDEISINELLPTFGGLTNHSNDFSLHLPHAREDIRMDRISNAEFPKGLRLYLQQVLATVVYSTADTSIFPPRVFHASQLVELGANLFWRPSFLWKSQKLGNLRTFRNKLVFKFAESRYDLLVYLAADDRSAQDHREHPEADGSVDVTNAANDAVAA